jgi:hypothetical protein
VSPPPDRRESEVDPLIGPGTSRDAPARVAADWALVVLFLIALWLPRVEMACHLFPSQDSLEKRRPTTAPSFRLDAIPEFLWSYEHYFTENFGLRGTLIRWDTVLRLKFLHASPVSRLIFGRGGWIYYNSDVVPDGITIRDFAGLAPYSREDLASVRNNLRNLTAWCRQRGILCVFLIVPNKETIYPEHLPPSIRKIGQTTRLDQVVADLAADAQVHLVDLRPALLRAKERSPCLLYSRGGTHWNQYGAFYGYESLMACLSPEFPRLRPYALDDFEVTVDSHSSADHWLGLRENTACTFRLKEDRARSDEAGRIGRALVIHDSAWDALEPFVSLHCREIVAQPADLSAENTREIVARALPELLIYEVTERYADRVWRERGF